MTGAFLRINRNGKWQSIEVEHLTDSEHKEEFKKREDCVEWINMLSKKIVEAENFLQELEKDGLTEKRTNSN